MQKKICKIKCKDKGCKLDKGFCGSNVMRTKKQQTKYDKRKQQQNDKNTAAVTPEAPMSGEVGGVVDLEEWLKQPQNYSQTGRALYMDPRCIPVQPFDPLEQFPEDMNPSIVVYGKRRTGKSFFLNWMMEPLDPFYNQVYVFTQTKHNNFWQQRVPSGAIYEGWKPDVAQFILQLQKLAATKPDEAWQKYKVDTQTAVLLDDVISSNILRTDGMDGPYAALYVEGRHYGKGSKSRGKGGFTIITNTQYATALHPKVRDNVDFAVCLRQDKNACIERIWDEYMSRLNRATAHGLIDMYTKVLGEEAEMEGVENEEANRMVFIINACPTRSWNHRFYYALPKETGDFSLGSSHFWRQMKGKDQ